MRCGWLAHGIVLVLLVTGMVALPPDAAAGQMEWSGGLWTGYRQDEVDFNISGGAGGPNILSELTWGDLEIWQVGVAGRLRFKPHRFPVGGLVRLNGEFGVIDKGENQDSDYDGNNRTQEFSRSNNKADGEVYDFSLGFGPEFSLRSARLHIAPLIGYAVHAQNLNVTDGYQTIPEMGSFSGLDSSYDTLWYGFWTGLESRWRPFAKLVVDGGIELHLVDFKATANWNLREDFAHPKSFEHWASGEGVQGKLGIAYETEGPWTMRLEYLYRRWQADDGLDRVYFADGTIGETALNEVNWRSQSLSLGVIYRF
ncbi:MAG: hypothetical protein WDA20_11540 [Desulfuromonadales bacterium]